MGSDLVGRLEGYEHGTTFNHPFVNCRTVAIGDIREAAARIRELEAALRWYEEQTRLAKLIHGEGDAGRHALQADGGAKARKALGGDNG